MTAMFPVQSGVPVPEVDRRQKNGRRKWPVDTMKPGDFFFLPGRTSKSASEYVSKITKNLPGKFAVRHIWAAMTTAGWEPCGQEFAGATEGAGVWRVE